MIRIARPHLGSLLAAAALCLAFGAAPAAARTRVALLPMVVHSMEDSAYLRAGIADMLAARLGLQPDLQVIPVSDASAATTDLAAARDAARAAGAEFVVFGSFTRFGEGASLDLQCASASGDGEARQIFVQSGAVGDLIPRLDDLAQRVAYYVKNGEAPAVSAAPPPTSAGVSRSDLDDLRRRVEALERAQRNAASATGGGEREGR